jgi:hypothetical protein
MKILPRGAELFHEDGRTDNSRFSQFSESALKLFSRSEILRERRGLFTNRVVTWRTSSEAM